jgi:CDP-diacylglycerol--glycerol-3-phosphate 3-phosphatidyltransferase
MFTDRARVATRGIITPIVRVLAQLGVTPDGLTVVGSGLHVGVAWIIASGHLAIGGVALGLAAAFDGLDGSLARLTNTQSKAGAFLDSSLDRVSEILVFFGLLVYSQRQGMQTETYLVYVAIVGSLMVSYTRARSEALGGGTKAGVFGRLERMVVLVVGLVLGQFIPVLLSLALWLLAAGTVFTAGHRIIDGYGRCKKLPTSAAVAAPTGEGAQSETGSGPAGTNG